MSFPTQRPRRLRRNPTLRRMVREMRLGLEDLVQPYFVVYGKEVRKPIGPMPGVFQLSVDALLQEAEQAVKAGIPAVILFGIPKAKDEKASEAYARDGIIPQAVGALKEKFPGLVVITDVCLCGYMSHGHCGIVGNTPLHPPLTVRGGTGGCYIDNDATLELLARTALSHARAGADVVAPSDMMDGRVQAIRRALDENDFQDTAILSYAAKYASAFYGPFREAAQSEPQFGDRKTYQMDPANAREAIREALLDVEEGADLIMVKPAGPYLDVIAKVREAVKVPVVAYQVSGEYSMIRAAAQNGWLEEKSVLLESLLAIKRAGADLIISYAARQVAPLLRDASE